MAGQQAELLFRLIGGTDSSSSSTVTLSDVNVSAASGPSVVPEPSAFFLGGLGILGGLGYVLCDRGRRVASGRPSEPRGRPPHLRDEPPLSPVPNDGPVDRKSVV